MVEHIGAGFKRRLASTLGYKGIDIAHKHKYRSKRVGGVKVVVHSGNKFLLAFFYKFWYFAAVLRVFQRKINIIAAGVKPFKRVFRLLYYFIRIVYWASVLAGYHHIAYRLIAVFFGDIAHGKEIAERL